MKKAEKAIEKLTVEQIAEMAYETIGILSMMNNFGLRDMADKLDIDDRLWAQISEQVNQIIDNYKPMPSWAELSKERKESAITHAQFYLDNPTANPTAAHENWLKRREADGWKYGEETDAEKKIDAGMIPYSHRSAYHNAKDYLFRRTVEILSR